MATCPESGEKYVLKDGGVRKVGCVNYIRPLLNASISGAKD